MKNLRLVFLCLCCLSNTMASPGDESEQTNSRKRKALCLNETPESILPTDWTCSQRAAYHLGYHEKDKIVNGVLKNPLTGMDFAQAGEDRKEVWSMARMASYHLKLWSPDYVFGLGTYRVFGKDAFHGMHLLLDLAKQKDPWALFALGTYHLGEWSKDTNLAGVQKDAQKGRQFIRQAADLGWGPAKKDRFSSISASNS